MDKLLIRGGRSLQGEVQISGAKNATLPELCTLSSTLLSAGRSTTQWPWPCVPLDQIRLGPERA